MFKFIKDLGFIISVLGACILLGAIFGTSGEPGEDLFLAAWLMGLGGLAMFIAHLFQSGSGGR